jgi:dimethylargininase
VLHRFYKDLEYIYSPGSLDGGDVMLVGDHFFIGLSERTNKNGADQFIQIAEKHGMSGTKIPLENLLHLKSGVSYLENNYMVMVTSLKKSNIFERFNQIRIPDEEAYAANCLWINGTVLVAEGFPETKALIESVGFKTIALDMSEFRKLDGGLSCLSLRV